MLQQLEKMRLVPASCFDTYYNNWCSDFGGVAVCVHTADLKLGSTNPFCSLCKQTKAVQLLFGRFAFYFGEILCRRRHFPSTRFHSV